MRTVFVIAAAMILTGCASAPHLEEVAIVECEALSSTGELRNCFLISQTVENSEFGASAVQIVAKGNFKPSNNSDRWQTVHVPVRKRS